MRAHISVGCDGFLGVPDASSRRSTPSALRPPDDGSSKPPAASTSSTLTIFLAAPARARCPGHAARRCRAAPSASRVVAEGRAELPHLVRRPGSTRRIRALAPLLDRATDLEASGRHLGVARPCRRSKLQSGPGCPAVRRWAWLAGPRGPGSVASARRFRHAAIRPGPFCRTRVRGCRAMPRYPSRAGAEPTTTKG